MNDKVNNQRVENNENEYENRILTEITIDYLINKKTYERLINLKKERIDDCYKKDKKFYKKRINNLTRNLMDNKKESYPNNINKTFDNYIKEAIEYFKLLDETDIFQEDYIGLQLLEEMELEEESEEKVEKINDTEIIKSFMLPKNNVPNLDNFVKIKKTQEEKIVKLPIQKEINLLDNQYKTKGISYT